MPVKIPTFLVVFALIGAATLALGQADSRETPTGQIERSPAQTSYLKRAAGFNALHGAGAIITLRDRDTSDAAKIVHDYDLLLVLNQLRAAKAEAIAVNGLRLGSHTSIRVVGSSIMLDDNRLQPPFRIDVIGDGEWFEKILRTSGLSESFGAGGPQMVVVRVGDVRVPALAQAPSFRFAKPD